MNSLSENPKIDPSLHITQKPQLLNNKTKSELAILKKNVKSSNVKKKHFLHVLDPPKFF